MARNSNNNKRRESPRSSRIRWQAIRQQKTNACTVGDDTPRAEKNASRTAKNAMPVRKWITSRTSAKPDRGWTPQAAVTLALESCLLVPNLLTHHLSCALANVTDQATTSELARKLIYDTLEITKTPQQVSSVVPTGLSLKGRTGNRGIVNN